MLTRRFLALLMLLCLAGLALAQTDQPEKPMRVRVSRGVADKNKIRDVKPEYPQRARANGIQGNVLLQVVIDTTGKPTNIKVLQGDPILAEAAMDAVRQWRYEPYTIKKKPVEVETTILIQFLL
jgi:protein TonB